MLWGVTRSGTVRLRAMLHGTPSSSMSIRASPVMTERAEKSTRLPMRLPRMRPCLPLRRWLKDLTGRLERLTLARGMPGLPLSMSVMTACCSSSTYSCRAHVVMAVTSGNVESGLMHVPKPWQPDSH